MTTRRIEKGYEAEAISIALCQPKIRRQLKQIPSLGVLLEGFQQHSSVIPFLEANKVVYTPSQAYSFDFDVREFLFGQSTHHRVRTLLRKATFSRWFYLKTNWHDAEQDDIIATIDKSAQFVSSRKPPKEFRFTASTMNPFLSFVITQEFADAVRNDYDLNEVFASKKQAYVTNRNDIDIAGTFGKFAESRYYPTVFDPLIKEYIEGTELLQSMNRLASMMFGDLCYSPVTKMHWISGALTLVENALSLKSDASLSWKKLAVDTKSRLKVYRSIFQQALPASEVRSLRT